MQIEMWLIDAGFEDVLFSERDLEWSFAVVGFKSSVVDFPS